MGFNWKKFLGIAKTVGVPILETVVPASQPVVGMLQGAFDQHGKALDAKLVLEAFLPLLEDSINLADKALTEDQRVLILTLAKGALLEAIARQPSN